MAKKCVCELNCINTCGWIHLESSNSALVALNGIVTLSDIIASCRNEEADWAEFVFLGGTV